MSSPDNQLSADAMQETVAQSETVEFPAITHQKFAIISVILAGNQAADDVRQELARLGYPTSDSSFSRLLSRICDDKLVEVRFDQTSVGQRGYPKRLLSVTNTGRKAHDIVLRFYKARSAAAGILEGQQTE